MIRNPIGKIRNVPNHQPDALICSQGPSIFFSIQTTQQESPYSSKHRDSEAMTGAHLGTSNILQPQLWFMYNPIEITS